MKEDLIKNYIAAIDFNRDWSLNQINEDLRKFLGEVPAIDVKWVKDVLLNEVNGEAKEIQKVDTISIVFTDTDNKFKKLEFRIND